MVMAATTTRATFDAFRAALESGNIDAVIDIYSEDAVVIQPRSGCRKRCGLPTPTCPGGGWRGFETC